MIKDFLTRILGKNPKNQVYSDYVVQVVNGNTLQTQKYPVSLKLAYVTAPELDTPKGKKVKAYLQSFVESRTVSVEQVSIEESGRPVAKVWFAGLNVNDHMNEYIDAQNQFEL